MPLRKFRYIGEKDVDTTEHGALSFGREITVDTWNDTPDGGVPGAHWEFLGDVEPEPEEPKVA